MTVTCHEMRSAEERCFASGISAGFLMEKASAGIASAIRQFFPEPGRLVLFLGSGNNAGDAIVAARILRELGWQIFLRRLSDELSDLAGEKLGALEKGDFCEIESAWALVSDCGGGPLLLLDGLVGIGARGALRSPLSEGAGEINALRERGYAQVVAVDIPSGVDGDTGEVYEGAVRADITCTVGAVKSGLLADSATDHVGRLVLIPLQELDFESAAGVEDGESKVMVLTPVELREALPVRGFDFHKGQAGRVGVVAGSRGMFGAACLSSEGALRAGAGLVTLYVLEEDYELVVGMVASEVMVCPVASYRAVLEHPVDDALAIGPGLGRSRDSEVIELCRKVPLPAVLDADALNALAAVDGKEELWGALGGPRLLTPHPGEMRRILGGHEMGDRADTVRRFVEGRNGLALLLKGARTVIGQDGRPLAFNTSGSPGMATGGMGDVLTGVAAGLLAQGCAVFDAGCLSAWLCARAAERAILEDGESVESLLAGSVLSNLGRAFRDLREGAW